MNKIFNFLFDAGNYESRKIGRIEPEDNNGIGVSTCYTSDEGFETALLDYNGVCVVERYLLSDQAIEGHKKWIEFAKNKKNKKVLQLGGLGGLVKDKIIILKRVK